MLNKTIKAIIIGAAAAATIAGASLSAGAAGADPWRGDDHRGGDGRGGDHRGGDWRDGDRRGGDRRGDGFRGDHDGWRDRGGGWHGRDDWGAAFGAGILGVVIGESLSHPYYGAPPGHYVGPGYWGYYGSCRGYWRWSYRFHRYVRDARCY